MNWSRRIQRLALIALLPATAALAQEAPSLRVGIQVERELARYDPAGRD